MAVIQVSSTHARFSFVPKVLERVGMSTATSRLNTTRKSAQSVKTYTGKYFFVRTWLSVGPQIQDFCVSSYVTHLMYAYSFICAYFV